MSKSTGIIYLLTNPQLAARLVVSIYSLRRWYSGPITLFTTRPESHNIGALCAEDQRLGIDHCRMHESNGKGHLSAYLTKTTLPRRGPYDVNVFLDADTLIWSSIDELLYAAQSVPLVVTGFCAGSTTCEPVKSRLMKWRKIRKEADRSYELRHRLKELLSTPFSAVNAGVFAFRRNADFAKRWIDLATLGRALPLPDEIALQIMLFEIEHMFLGYQYNCHPSFFDEQIGARIWHFAGRTHLSDSCRPFWLPVYKECVRRDVAKLGTWSRVTSGDRGEAEREKLNSA